ncbi:MAG: Alpha amylase, catalytic region [Thermoleophilia bacterium]|nr:Alpha amylase, catalytic region [Thermoleophilia bacterium]
MAAPWIRDAVVYGVLPPKFGPHGFADVTARLGELQRTGVNTLWLAPLNTPTQGDYGYEVVDHAALRPDWGTHAELRELVRSAHARGMHVIADVVPNHTHDDHPWYQDVLARGKASPYWGRYERGRDGAPTHYFDWEHLPNLDYDNAAVRRYMTDTLVGMVRDYDLDGFRVDVAWGVHERRPDFFPALRQALDAVKPDTFLLAEAPARDGWFSGAGFDAAYDWAARFQASWKGAFDDPAQTADRLRTALRRDTPTGVARDGAAQVSKVLRLLDSNDLGVHFRRDHGVRTARLGAWLLATLPGIPALFTGTDVGASYDPYRDPRPLTWHDPDGLRATWTAALGVRRELPALTSDSFRLLTRAQTGAGVLGYVRGDAGDAGAATVLLNFDATAHDVELRGAGLHDAATGADLAGVGGRVRVHLAPGQARILQRR